MLYFLYSLIFPNGKRYIGLTNDPARRDHTLNRQLWLMLAANSETGAGTSLLQIN